MRTYCDTPSTTQNTSPAGQSALVLVFENGWGGIWIVLTAAFVVFAVVADTSSVPGSGGVVIGCLLMAAVVAVAGSRRWCAEFDLRTRILKISRRSFGRWTKTKVRCSFEQCRQLGRIEYETEENPLYGVYIELMDGTRHAIPLKYYTIQEAGRVAAQICGLTGIPRLDTKF
jgi:hypothetical protein